MKRIIAALCIMLTVFAFVGCSGAPDIETPNTIPPSVETQDTVPEVTNPPVVITDYTITGMLNVTKVYFSAKSDRGWWVEVDPKETDPAAITVHVMCPLCHEETADFIDLSEIPQTHIGQSSFTWSEEISCGNWSNHSDHFDTDYTYSIIFTLNG